MSNFQHEQKVDAAKRRIERLEEKLAAAREAREHLDDLPPELDAPKIEKFIRSSLLPVRMSLELVRSRHALGKLQGQEQSDEELSLTISRTLFAELERCGKFLHLDNQAHFHLKGARTLGLVHRDDPWWCRILAECGFPPNTPIEGIQRRRISDRVKTSMASTPTKHLVAIDKSTWTMFVNLGGGRMAEITPEAIAERPFGFKDIFFGDPLLQPFSTLDLANLPSVPYGLKYGDTPLDREFTGNFEPGHSQQLYMALAVGLMFTTMYEMRQCVVITGPPRSGKTTLALKPGKLLLGSAFAVAGLGGAHTTNSKDVENLETLLTNSALAVIDNADKPSEVRPFESLLSRAVTGGVVTRRVMRSTNEIAQFRMTADIYITSTGNPCTDPALVDRIITLRALPYSDDDGQKTSPSVIIGSLIAKRDELMAEMLVRCQRVLAALKAYEGQNLGGLAPVRQTEFADFVLKSAKLEGWEDEALEMLRSIRIEATNVLEEENTLIPLLLMVVGDNRVGDLLNMSASELHSKLAQASKKFSVEYRPKNPIALSHDLKRDLPVLRKAVGLERTRDSHSKAWKYSLQPPEGVRRDAERQAERSKPREFEAVRYLPQGPDADDINDM